MLDIDNVTECAGCEDAENGPHTCDRSTPAFTIHPGALVPDGTRHTRPGGHAYLERHTYKRYTGPEPVRMPYVVVRCDHPSHGLIGLNSGHAYFLDELPHADALARRHDAAEHPEG